MSVQVDDFFGDVLRLAAEVRAAKARAAKRRGEITPKYSPDQPRDDQGRFSSGGGGGSGYREAATLKEAEEVAQQWVDGEVHYDGIALEAANQVNQELDAVYSEFPGMEKLQGLEAINFTWSGLPEAADAGYSPGNKMLVLNTEQMGDMDHWNEHVMEGLQATSWAKGLSESDIAQMSPDTAAYMREVRQYDRRLVDPTIRGAVRHEMGHHFDRTVLMKPENQASRREILDNRAEFQQKISHYASTSPEEYIAESFAAYGAGQGDVLDMPLRGYFDMHRRK